MSLLARLRQPRTFLSVALPLLIMALAATLNWKDLQAVPSRIAAADPRLLILAASSYYLGFLVRGYRWQRLLAGAGYKVRTRDATEILFLSWLVNCVVPAKLGDLYRVYLLKINAPVSGTKTLGTLFTERIFDLLALGLLGLLSGYWCFHDRLNSLPDGMRLVFFLAAGLVILLLVVMVGLYHFGARVVARLPLPAKIATYYQHLEAGIFGSLNWRSLPTLSLLTALVWLSESVRLYLVILALGFQLDFSAVVFVTLIGALLTAVPLTPAGLGLVELGMGGVLTKIFNFATGPAVAIILVDRTISVFSIIILGSLAYLVSGKPRGHGLPMIESPKPFGL